MDEIRFNGYENTSLFGRIWKAKDVRASLLIVHGFGEHGGRYADFAAYLNDRGITVMAYDNRGHGRSDGKRGVIMNWSEFRDDISAALGQMERHCPNVPIFLMGHSLGGTMVLDYGLEGQQKPNGIICSAPALGRPAISPILISISRVLSILTPRLALNAGLETAALSRDPTVVQSYIADPLVHGKGSARLSTELTRIQGRIFKAAHSLSCPLLLSYGSDDRIAPRAPIERFHKLVGSKDKGFVVFEGSYHEIHNDLDKLKVYQTYSDWIVARL